MRSTSTQGIFLIAIWSRTGAGVAEGARMIPSTRRECSACTTAASRSGSSSVSDRKTISPSRLHSASMAQIMSAKYGLEMAEIARPTLLEEARFSARASVFGA